MSASAAASPLVRRNSPSAVRQRRFGDDLRLDAGRQPLGPGLVVILDGGQPLFFPDQGVDIANAVFHTQIHPFKRRPDDCRTNLINPFNVPLRFLAHLLAHVRWLWRKKLTRA